MSKIKPILDGWLFVDLGPDGGPYDEMSNPKVELHTWEGTNWKAAEKSYAPYPPSCAANWMDEIKKQYIRLDRHSYANKGSESDDEFIVQFEMAGFSALWHTVPDRGCRFYGDCIKQLCDAVQAPIVFPKQGFHGPNEGIYPYISTIHSPIRFKSERELRAFSGICGHQHMPSPDTHWDPGLPPFDRMGLNQGDVILPESPPERTDISMEAAIQLIKIYYDNARGDGKGSYDVSIHDRNGFASWLKQLLDAQDKKLPLLPVVNSCYQMILQEIAKNPKKS